MLYNIVLHVYRAPTKRKESADTHLMEASYHPSRDQLGNRVGSPTHFHAQHGMSILQ